MSRLPPPVLLPPHPLTSYIIHLPTSNLLDLPHGQPYGGVQPRVRPLVLLLSILILLPLSSFSPIPGPLSPGVFPGLELVSALGDSAEDRGSLGLQTGGALSRGQEEPLELQVDLVRTGADLPGLGAPAMVRRGRMAEPLQLLVVGLLVTRLEERR